MLLEEKRKIKREINRAITTIDSTPNRKSVLSSNSFDWLYNFATEDMRGYYKEFGKLRSFLTVGASGDQLLNAIKFGAEKIDVFDLNPLAKRQCAKKVSAAKVLTSEEIYNYFTSFDESTYLRFRNKFLEEDRIFWDSLFDYKGEEEVAELYPYCKLSKELIFDINPYLDEDGYKNFQNKLDEVEINYIDSDVYSLDKFLGDNTYDGMNFSNIYEYLNYGRKVNSLDAFRYYEFIMKQMYPRLNDEGIIMVSYMYSFSDRVKSFLKKMEDSGELKELIYSKGISIENLPLFASGVNAQNYAYTLLLDIFEENELDKIKKVATSHVEFGISFDNSHDLALCLKKTR